MAILTVNNIQQSFGEEVILQDISFEMQKGERVGLVGVNGSGKTTLFKVLTGEYTPDAGTVVFGKDTVLGYMEQHVCRDFHKTAFEEVMTVFAPLLRMERELEPPLGAGGLALEPLDRARGGAWLALHNACFFDMPNSATYGPRDLDRAMSPGHDCGFVRRGEELAGVYELDLAGETPEIEGIALKEDLRGRGLGRALLGAAMERLGEKGFARCGLLVATDNAPAFSLYHAAGFRAAEVRSRWFRMLAE